MCVGGCYTAMHLIYSKYNITKRSLCVLTATYSLNNFITWRWQIVVSNVGQGKENPVKTRCGTLYIYEYMWMNTGFEFLVLKLQSFLQQPIDNAERCTFE